MNQRFTILIDNGFQSYIIGAGAMCSTSQRYSVTTSANRLPIMFNSYTELVAYLDHIYHGIFYALELLPAP